MPNDLPEATPEAEETSQVPERTGLHFTPEEVLAWRQRAEGGPYRSSGDVAGNSPGDWDRIVARSAAFLQAPAAGRWAGPAGEGCIQQWAEAPPVAPTNAMRDAAFLSLVTGDTTHHEPISRELLAQASTPGTNFGDGSRWCTGVLVDVNPSFDIALWLTKLLFAYDYLGPDAFSSEERVLLDNWFSAAAALFQHDLDASLDQLFHDRAGEDYRINEPWRSTPGCDDIAYFGGPPVCAVARVYNNRHAAIAAFVGLVGVHQDDDDLRETAGRFVRELIIFSVYPDGALGDFERGSPDHPYLGWAYANGALGAAVTVANAFDRAGDPSLFAFETDEGAQGTEGGPKSLLFAIHALGRYVDGTFDRYATAEPSQVGDPATRIRPSSADGGWQGVNDVWHVVANRYYQDPYIRQMYTRTGEGIPPYPAATAPGPWEQWEGEGGIYPGVLFMFGGLENPVAALGREATRTQR